MKEVSTNFKDELGIVHGLCMLVSVKLETSPLLFKWACEFTSSSTCYLSPSSLYGCEHSPIRTQIFSVRMWDIPTFASVHFRTHKIGAQQFDEDEHFVKSNREDRKGYSGDDGRWQVVNHMMLLNSQSLISMSRRRLCTKAHPVVVMLMNAIKIDMVNADPGLSKRMVPDCAYRGGCMEPRPCGVFSNKINRSGRDIW